jgi:hypothetical protein
MQNKMAAALTVGASAPTKTFLIYQQPLQKYIPKTSTTQNALQQFMIL